MTKNVFDGDGELGGVLGQVAGQLKRSLGNIHGALERIAPPELRDGDQGVDMDAALLCQSYYRILRLANNLLDAAELEGPNRARLRNDDIVGFCRALTDRVEMLAGLMGLSLEFRCDRSIHIIAMDPDRLERLVLNLLSNAFKFTPRGGRVTLEVAVAPRYVELRVTDTGRVIPPVELETVFDRYRQGERVDPPPHGLGLGLPICRRIAWEHGGTILLTSRPGEGTRVVVSLPNQKASRQELSAYIVDYAGGFNHTLLELADALPKQAFTQRHLD